MSDVVPSPNEKQREALCDMLYYALLDMRALAWAGKTEQVADLTDAFHNLPQEMYGSGGLNVRVFRRMLQRYQQKHSPAGIGCFEYVTLLDRIFPGP